MRCVRSAPLTTARFGQPEVNLGIIGLGRHARLARTSTLGFAKGWC
jgi:enoyl-CoA hydratase/carnithine racemase